jgi:2-dehydropantoate 2-reductase
MTVDVITRIAGPERTLGCVIEVASMLFTPGVIERHSPPSRSWFAVGSLNDATKGREGEVAEILRHSGQVDVVNNIRATKWMKLVSNATTLVTTAILGLPMIEASNIPEMRELMIRSGQEALDATVGVGNPVLPIFGLTSAEIAQAQVVSLLLDKLLDGFTMPNTITTILQDWMKGRRSEVDDINGLVVSTLTALGQASPVNSAIVEVAHAIEKGDSQPGIENLEVLMASCNSPQK